RPLDDVLTTARRRWKDAQADRWVLNALNTLHSAGLLTDAASRIPTHDRLALLADRYDANVNFWELMDPEGRGWAIQEVLDQSRVVVLGVGGLGTHVSFALAGVGIGTLTLVDFDRVEAKNLNRQILYTAADIGKPKVDVAQQRLQDFHPSITIEAITKRISGANDLFEPLKGATWVVCVADTPSTQIHQWVNEAAVACRVPVTFGGVLGRVGVYSTIMPDQSGCVACQARHMTDEQQALWDVMQQRQFQRVNAAIAPHVSMLAGIIVKDVIRGLLHMTPHSLGAICHYDFNDLQERYRWPWPRDPQCRVCKGRDEVNAQDLYPA
ncbi:MAG: ThiF family adenylyltransferase, partial [Sulfobacillus sp.]|nr:ThiF family adenylyltransferase [Sulfobacillus sp.]